MTGKPYFSLAETELGAVNVKIPGIPVPVQKK
jgi:hypothetical protein